jgi:ComF family protein
MFAALRSRSIAWPGACHVCGRWPTAPVCDACIARFARPLPRCPHCAAPLAGERCTACVSHPAAPGGPERCLVAVDYRYPWDALIARLKFRGEAGWATPFAHLMLQAPGARTLLDGCDWIAPVPLTPARLSERGHHTPWELVKALVRQHPRPACADALARLSDGPAQHRLARAERLRNLASAFVVPPQRLAALAGRRVLLIDDVTTTGATLLAAAQALRAAGVSGVDALVFARTPGPHDTGQTAWL